MLRFRYRALMAPVVLLLCSGCGAYDNRSAAVVSSSESGAPLLGRAWGGTRGYGTVEPREIFNGGDPTGLVFDIEWESWGDQTAVGHGTGYLPPPELGANAAQAEPATVIASDLGDCDGVFAYRDIRWFFVEAGESINLEGDPEYDTCELSAELHS